MNIVHHSSVETQEKKRSLPAENKMHFTWILRGSVFVALLLGFFYLMFLNKIATRGFALEELKTQRMEIQKQVEAWDIALAIPTSLYALQSSEQVQEMENVTRERKYVFIEEGVVAMKNEE